MENRKHMEKLIEKRNKIEVLFLNKVELSLEELNKLEQYYHNLAENLKNKIMENNLKHLECVNYYAKEWER